MEYTSNYHLSKPESDDIINPTSRTGYNGNFDTLDSTLKSVSNKANANESNITDLQGDIADIQGDITNLQGDIADINAKTGDDIPFESGSADSISDKITNLDNSVGNKPSGEQDTLWDKIGILSNNETDIVEQSFLVFNKGTSAQYYSSTTDISKDGYVPIYVGYDLSQISLHIYLLRMYKSTTDGKFYVNWGLTASTGGLSSAVLTLKVVYRKV